MAATTSRSAIVTDWVLAGIREGRLEPNEKLPSEESLGRDLGTSRATVREALTELVNQGYVVRRHGSGTYVVPRAVISQDRIDRLTTFTEIIRDAGYAPELADWAVETVDPPTEVAVALEASRIDRALLVKRVYLAGRVRVAYCEGYVPAVWQGQEIVLDGPGELRWQLEELLGVRVTHQVVQLQAVAASEAVSEELRVPRGAPLLLSRELSLVGDGPPLLFGLNYSDTTLVTPSLVRVPTPSAANRGDGPRTGQAGDLALRRSR
ncbi:MAG: GntR family transcriptional regulator [Actinomycetota bacterium]|nr:GntR family transcriptional regulator [Actinomycetota bacterium]